MSQIPKKFPPSEKLEYLKRFAAYLVETEQYACGKCGNIYPNTEETYPYSGRYISNVVIFPNKTLLVYT